MQCPIVIAINEIRVGGYYKDEDSDVNVIKIGGNDSPIEFVCDEVGYYIMSRKMELARFELSNPNHEATNLKYRLSFGWMIPSDYSQLYTRIIDRAIKKDYLYNQFVQLVNLIGEMEEFIITSVAAAGRAGKVINVSLPDIILMPHIDQIIVYRPDVLMATINKIISYINRLNITSLLGEPVQKNIEMVTPFTGIPPCMSTQVISKAVVFDSAEKYLKSMHELLAHEIIVADYVQKVENYQCGVINKMNSIYDVCKKIISLLIARSGY